MCMCNTIGTSVLSFSKTNSIKYHNLIPRNWSFFMYSFRLLTFKFDKEVAIVLKKVSLIFMYFQPCHTAHFDVLLIEYSHWFGTNFLSFRRLRNAGSGSKVSPCRIAVFLSFTHYSFWKLTCKQIKHKTSITISCIAHSLSSLFLDPIFSYLIE